MAARDVKNDQLKAMTHDAHAMWLASMDDDERFLVHCPDGQWHDLIMAAYFKRALLTSPMTADERLRFLEFLEVIPATSSMLTREVVAAIQPATDVLMKIIHEARALDREENHGQASLEMLSSWECRWHALRVQPSLLEALRLSPAARQQPSNDTSRREA